MTSRRIGAREEWAAARRELLAREKEHTRLGDELAQQRRELPCVPVEKQYGFQTEDGPKTLAELFAARSQLVVYHFMFGPDYETPCKTCSSIADSFNGVIPHLGARDVTMIVVSRSPLEKLLAWGVKVHAVLPGPIDTDMVRDLPIPKTPPESVARAVFDQVENEEEEIFPTHCRRCWPTAGARARPRNSSARTQRSSRQSLSRREQTEGHGHAAGTTRSASTLSFSGVGRT